MQTPRFFLVLVMVPLLLARPGQCAPVAGTQAAAPRILSVALAPPRDPAVDTLLASIGAWADAWSNQDLPRYLAFYSEQFLPDNKAPRSTWKLMRSESLRRARQIDVRISQLRVKPWEPDTYRVSFIQVYHSSRRQESNLKVQLWRREGSSWRIVREQVLA